MALNLLSQSDRGRHRWVPVVHPSWAGRFVLAGAGGQRRRDRLFLVARGASLPKNRKEFCRQYISLRLK